MIGRRHTTVEFLSGVIACEWGLAVANPWTDTFKLNPLFFAPMRALVGSEVFWGVLYAAFGATALALYYSNYKTWSAMLLFFIFTSLSVLFLLGDVRSYAFIIYGTIGVVNLMRWRGFYIANK